MMYRVPVIKVSSGEASIRRAHLAVVMQYYPRFLKKDLISEYLRSLAPPRALLTEFKTAERATGDHNGAFQSVHYEARFELQPQGLEDLKRLSDLSREQEVMLVCQCLPPQKCHTDLLLLMARHHFGAPTQTLWHRYPAFEARLDSLNKNSSA